MDYDAFRFFEQVSWFEDAVAIQDERIANLAVQWEQGNLKKKTARTEIRETASEVEALGEYYQVLVDTTPDGHEKLMEDVKDWWSNLKVDLKGLRDLVK